MSRFRIVLLAAALVVAAFAWDSPFGAGAVTGTNAGSFTITHTVVPLFVKQNGPKATRAVYWAGNPTFPVTLHERGICPDSVNCGPRDAQGFGATGTTVFTKHANPLVTPSFYFCSGGLTQNYVIGLETWLTDAKGHRTQNFRNFWVCKTH